MDAELPLALPRLRRSVLVLMCLTTVGCGQILGDRCTPGEPAPPPTLSPQAASMEWSTSGVPSNSEAEVAMDELYLRTTPFELEPGTADVTSVCVPNSECALAAQQLIESCPETIKYQPPGVVVDSVTQVSGTEPSIPSSATPSGATPSGAGSTDDGGGGGGGGEPRYLVAHLRTDHWGETRHRAFDGFMDDDELIIQRWPQDPDLPWRFVSAPVL